MLETHDWQAVVKEYGPLVSQTAYRLLGNQADAGGCERNADSDDPLDQIETQDLAGRLREAIGQLPPQEAKVFCLRHLNEMSYRQIARELQIGVRAVGVSLHRAKTRLREPLAATDVKDEVSNGAR